MGYTWDNNGNLLNNGAKTYTYDHANRLASWLSLPPATTFAYNGLGDRLRHTVSGVTTSYTLDLAGGLTQVLSDGTHAYLYGNERLGQFTTSTSQYFLGDALNSVRQITDASGAVTLAKAYQPFGDVLNTYGSASSPYGYTGEWRDASGLIYQ